jgi:hypothetical protein
LKRKQGATCITVGVRQLAIAFLGLSYGMEKAVYFIERRLQLGICHSDLTFAGQSAEELLFIEHWVPSTSPLSQDQTAALAQRALARI